MSVDIVSLQIMHSILKDELDRLIPDLCSGAYDDFPSYREAVGRYKSLMKSLDAIKETLNKLKEDDE